MNNALKNIHLPAGTTLRGAVAMAVVGCALLGAATSSLAEPGQDGPHWGRRDDAAQRAQQSQQAQQAQQAQQSQQGRRGDNRGEMMRQPDPRMADDQRSMAQGQDGGRRNGRLTPDERRDLRRQINEAGQDIYAAPPRR
ncbi:MAG: hypothetical protein H7Z39_12125 [Burkholderiaceae bacterium]|nr:hypothetical protein [Burkholderiaceae bacterium]